MGESSRQIGALPSGSQYIIEVPANYNGTLLLCARPLPTDPGDPPWGDDDVLMRTFRSRGFALAGSANTIFWPLERAFADQPPLLDLFDSTVGPPERTVAWGPSIGGIMTAGFVQCFPERLSGALPLCGNLAGAVGIHNRELDIAFVFRALLAGDRPLQLVNIPDPPGNLDVARQVLAAAQQTPAGRARLGLAAAVGNIPGWHDPLSPEADPDDVETQQANQVLWMEEIGLLVYFLLRAQVEMQAGGNPSWNAGVDYTAQLARSITRSQVESLYDRAGLDLAADLETLATAPRIEADPAAVGYLERHIAFDGQLGGVPVLTVHTDGDGLVTPDNERAYGDVVAWAGQQEQLRQLYVHRGGHCSFTIAETLTALDALMSRIETGSWPALDVATLNAAASAMGPELNVLSSGEAVAPAFFDYAPTEFLRPHDVRNRVGR
ncbi:MAG: hypothetical protein M3042_01875 [Actinomycetota bacterium]|nr:hypothetical protein [Actinomycetota bacterium]